MFRTFNPVPNAVTYAATKLNRAENDTNSIDAGKIHRKITKYQRKRENR